MSDSVAAYATRRDLGRIERRIPLRAELLLPSSRRAPVELCLTTTGAWLVAAAAEDDGAAVAVLDSERIEYRTDKKRDTLVVGDLTVDVSSSARDDVLDLLGVARLRRGGPGTFRPLSRARHVESPSRLERAALERFVESDEVVLAHLRLNATTPIDSWLLERSDAELHLVLTGRRMALLALSPAGDLTVTALEPADVRIDGKDVVILDRYRARARPAVAEVVELAALSQSDRVLEVARLNWLGRADADHLSFSRGLLATLEQRRDPIGTAAAYLVSAELGEPPSARPEVGAALEADGRALVRLTERWQLSTDTIRSFIDALRATGPVETALVLHDALRKRRLDDTDDALERAAADVDYAEHALSLGARDAARRPLEERLAALPIRGVDEVAPSSKRAADTLAARVRILELLAEARGSAEKPDVDTVAALTRLQPLATERLERLASLAAEPLAHKARMALEVLAGRTLTRPAPPTARGLTSPFKETELAVLRHPSSPDEKALFGALQSLVASTDAPALGVVRDYCAVLTGDGSTPGDRAFAAARTALGVSNVEAYVSRGRRDVGVRSFEGDPPFVLVGGRHLDAGDRFALSESELRFCFGAELAHVRFGHARVTSEQVWEGVLSKGRQGLDVFLGLLPMLRGLETAGRFGRVASRIEPTRVRRAVESATAINDAIVRTVNAAFKLDDVEPSGIAASNERLIAAHRFVQLSADRAGLALAGDLRSALRAILLTRRDYAALLSELEQSSIEPLLEARIARGDPAFADLSVRIAALVSFFLSSEYDAVAQREPATEN